MATVERFEDLKIWQLSRQLVNKVYDATDKKAFAKDYGLKDQLLVILNLFQDLLLRLSLPLEMLKRVQHDKLKALKAEPLNDL